MDPAIITLENHVSGDTWQGIPVIGPIQIQSGSSFANFPYPLELVRLHLARLGSKKASLTLSSSGSSMAPIDILDANTWQMAIPPVAPSVWSPEPGNYQGHFECSDEQGTIITLYDIRFQVLPDKTA